ncbi:MAG TPA: hypothetical protein ENG83_14670 [Nitrospirae bacterium]|nr:hypothetical protein BMS3Abin06_01614 [bacterium BMS3Abin06]HDH13413.1 hypothetical protein [Nitrospirota bacterium]HDZ02172.1 hypothetical protein [Nitrospirota bacterium]
MKKFKIQNSKLKIMMPLLLLLLVASGCQKVDKPVKGGSGPMAIVIDAEEPPESHTANTTSEGKELVSPYAGIPVVGSIFTSSLKGLDFWKANHPNFVTGTNNPALIVETEDEEELCLDCHDQNTSCNNCHSYVGVGLITGGE